MKKDMEEWGNSVKEKLDCSPPLHVTKKIELTAIQLHTRVSSKSNFNWLRLSMVNPLCKSPPSAHVADVFKDKNRADLTECRKWLGAIQSPDVEYKNNRKHFTANKDSCSWLLKTEQYQIFANPRERKHIWVYGKPGTGQEFLSAPLLQF